MRTPKRRWPVRGLVLIAILACASVAGGPRRRKGRHPGPAARAGSSSQSWRSWPRRSVGTAHRHTTSTRTGMARHSVSSARSGRSRLVMPPRRRCMSRSACTEPGASRRRLLPLWLQIQTPPPSSDRASGNRSVTSASRKLRIPSVGRIAHSRNARFERRNEGRTPRNARREPFTVPRCFHGWRHGRPGGRRRHRGDDWASAGLVNSA